MDPHGHFQSVDFSSTHENKAKHAGSEAPSDETYCADQLNVSGNSCDCAGYFEMPDCVMDVYLQAIDGGDETNAALRNISNVYGPREDDQEVDTNCNHNVSYEPYPNEGCGCSGSYNGGAGGGTAVCSYDPCGPYEHGFIDKKRDPICCCCQDDAYEKGLVNKKPCCTDEYRNVPPYLAPELQSPPSSGLTNWTSFDDTYQQPLANKKPDCPDKYVPMFSQPDPYCSANDSSCCGCISGSTAYAMQRSFVPSPDRSTFYADETCDCSRIC